MTGEADHLLEFIELRVFTARWDALTSGDSDLQDPQYQIMEDPKAGAVVKGTRGLRKLRFAPAKGNQGKRGALRGCYVCFERHATVLLVIVYAKNEADNLPEAAKKRINVAIETVEAELENKHHRKM